MKFLCASEDRTIFSVLVMRRQETYMEIVRLLTHVARICILLLLALFYLHVSTAVCARTLTVHRILPMYV